MKYLIFGKFSFNHIYFLFYAIFRTIQEVLEDTLKGNEVAIKFYILYLTVISHLLSVIPFFIYKKLSKTRREERKSKASSKNENEINFIYNDISRTFQKNLAKSTLIVAIFEFLAEILIFFFIFLISKLLFQITN